MITAAAAIMVIIFGSFVLGDDPFVKMFGLGLAVAVLVDATVVRMVVVPATMELLGDANWWIPRFFCRAICPLGALLGVFSRFSLWRIDRDPVRCTDCDLCI